MTNSEKQLKKKSIQTILLRWYREVGRHDLPWRQTLDLYEIAISEIMLQQTNVPKVIPKYTAFLKKFPTVESLAKARQSSVLRAWQGLGYNRRALNLHKMAKEIVASYEGEVPTDKDTLLTLPGIGPYTSSAIVVFGLNKDESAVDVNIERLIRRLHGKRDWEKIADKEKKIADFVPKGSARDYHSAVMDFSSRICTRRSPKCEKCPLSKICKSYPDPDDFTKTKKKEVGRTEDGKHVPRRIFRGRIVECLRKGAKDEITIGTIIKSDWIEKDDHKWLSEILDKLEKEGMIKQAKGKWKIR